MRAAALEQIALNHARDLIVGHFNVLGAIPLRLGRFSLHRRLGVGLHHPHGILHNAERALDVLFVVILVARLAVGQHVELLDDVVILAVRVLADVGRIGVIRHEQPKRGCRDKDGQARRDDRQPSHFVIARPSGARLPNVFIVCQGHGIDQFFFFHNTIPSLSKCSRKRLRVRMRVTLTSLSLMLISRAMAAIGQKYQ